MVAIVFLWRPAPALTVIVCGYAASGPVLTLVRMLRRRPGGGLEDRLSEPPSASDSAEKHA